MLFNQKTFTGLHTKPGTVLVIHPKEHKNIIPSVSTTFMTH